MDLVPLIERLFSMPGRLLIRLGRPAEGLFMISRGTVNVVDAKDKVIVTRISGEFVGDQSLLDDKPAMATVVAAEFCELFLLRRSEFAALSERCGQPEPTEHGRTRQASRSARVSHS